jgi:hypothetical protein
LPTNPFQDDPIPPTPQADLRQDARRHPIWKTTPAQSIGILQARPVQAQNFKGVNAPQPRLAAVQQPTPAAAPQPKTTLAEAKPAAPAAVPEVKPAHALKPLAATEISVTKPKADESLAEVDPTGPAPIVMTSRRGNGNWSLLPNSAQPSAGDKMAVQSVLRRASLEEEIANDSRPAANSPLAVRSIFGPDNAPKAIEDTVIPNNPLRR